MNWLSKANVSYSSQKVTDYITVSGTTDWSGIHLAVWKVLGEKLFPLSDMYSGKKRVMHHKLVSELFSSLGGAICLQSLDLVHGSKDGLCGGCGAAGFDCLSSFSRSMNLFQMCSPSNKEEGKRKTNVIKIWRINATTTTLTNITYVQKTNAISFKLYTGVPHFFVNLSKCGNVGSHFTCT